MKWIELLPSRVLRRPLIVQDKFNNLWPQTAETYPKSRRGFLCLPTTSDCFRDRIWQWVDICQRSAEGRLALWVYCYRRIERNWERRNSIKRFMKGSQKILNAAFVGRKANVMDNFSLLNRCSLRSTGRQRDQCRMRQETQSSRGRTTNIGGYWSRTPIGMAKSCTITWENCTPFLKPRPWTSKVEKVLVTYWN